LGFAVVAVVVGAFWAVSAYAIWSNNIELALTLGKNLGTLMAAAIVISGVSSLYRQFFRSRQAVIRQAEQGRRTLDRLRGGRPSFVSFLRVLSPELSGRLLRLFAGCPLRRWDCWSPVPIRGQRQRLRVAQDRQIDG
jgi:hypothetical protein